jgi:hypothetical protein
MYDRLVVRGGPDCIDMMGRIACSHEGMALKGPNSFTFYEQE